jgi:hypothetical protein
MRLATCVKGVLLKKGRRCSVFAEMEVSVLIYVPDETERGRKAE